MVWSVAKQPWLVKKFSKPILGFKQINVTLISLPTNVGNTFIINLKIKFYRYKLLAF